MSIGVLWLLASVDAAFCGYRAAAGRCGLIRKRAYYRRAMARGFWWGQGAVVVVGCVAAMAVALASDRDTALRRLVEMADRMAAVYVPYALAIGGALLVRTLPSVDLRSLTSTLVFGPLTLMRPAVVVAGLAAALWRHHSAAAWSLVLVTGALMLAFESVLSRAYARNPVVVPGPGPSG